jgi:Na+/H+ antiporter NhaD/arsenite permease-like protein
MVIVELIDLHQGFAVITERITTRNKRLLLWIVCFIAFFLSAVLDNLTTTIVMVSLVLKLVSERKDRLLFVSMVVIAANAGGAWSPIGDVTTTMLWIRGHITSSTIILYLILPSLACMIVPLSIASFLLKGRLPSASGTAVSGNRESTAVFSLGIGVLLFVPLFKTITHLPPFVGILLGLSILWIFTEIIHRKKIPEERDVFTVAHALRRIDLPTVLFFLGILLCISALEITGQLSSIAQWLDRVIGNPNRIAFVLGLLSAVVDNVPLVAAAMRMYNFPVDNSFWLFLSYCVGTGGSALIIGSAAGVAAMGIAKIDFFWYLRRITLLALAGYGTGAAVYWLIEKIII